uniref:Growth differentiation factor 5 opposite strand n=1 Tax=Equus asinus asinus TaxID=83772 RepID=A0A8C4LA02_EQUAS
MIQSSQPMSLKLTCSAFLLQRALGFLVGRLPWRVASEARRFRRWLNRYSYTVLSSWPERALISLKNRSRFLVRPNTRNRAFSWTCRAVRSKPRPRRSTARPRSQASSSRHSWAEFLKFRKSFQMSNTSQPDPSRPGTERTSSKAAGCRPLGQLDNFSWAARLLLGAPGLAVSEDFFRKIRSSAPSSPSFSRALMSNTYLCFLTTGPRSSRENTQKSFPATSPRGPVTSRPQGKATALSPSRDLSLTSSPL